MFKERDISKATYDALEVKDPNTLYYIKNCHDCIHYQMCGSVNVDAPCVAFKEKNDLVFVVRCKDCQYGRPIDNTKSPEKYFKDDCVVCECEDVVGDEPMIYPPSHFCSYGKMDGGSRNGT